MTIAVNVLKEKTRRKDFYIIAAVGILFILVLSPASSSIMIGGVPITTFQGMLPIVITVISTIACASAIALSLGTIPNEYKRQTSHLIWVRGIKQVFYHANLTLGNIMASLFSTFVLYGGILLFVVVKGELSLVPRLVMGYLLTCIPVCICSMAASSFTLKLPYMVGGILSIVFLLMGLFHPLLETLSNMVSGFAGQFLRILLYCIPNLYTMQSQASKFVLGNGLDGNIILQGMLFIYVFSLFIVFLKRKEA